MVSPAEVDGVHVHATVVGPVVRQSNNELHARLLRCPYNLVEGLNVDGGPVEVPALEHNFGFIRRLVVKLRHTVG